MSHVSVMVGNSSSGIIEAPSFHLPVVNIGIRQLGRVQAENVINVDYTSTQILAGIQKALSTEIEKDLQFVDNPYSDGSASDKIVDKLKHIELGDQLIKKGFHDQKISNFVSKCGSAG